MASTSSKRVGMLALALVAITLLAAAVRSNNGRSARTEMTAAVRAQQAERERIQTHLTGAERLLLGADASHLTPAQRAARSHNIALLRGYRERGIFPRNIDFPNSREPYFVDDRGVLCAMAYLIASSDRRDIVERIRATRNNARIRELADDTELVAWLDEAGLTAAEAARIQPEYNGGGVGVVVPDSRASAVSSEYAVASAASSFLSGAGIVLNLPLTSRGTHPTWRGVLAAGAGGLGLALGLPRIDDGARARRLGIWNAATGVLSLGFGTHTLFRRARVQPPAAATEVGDVAEKTVRQRSSRDLAFTVTPTVGSAPGVQFHIAF